MAVGVRVSPSGASVYIDPNALARFVSDGGGPVIAELARRGTNVQAGARQQVGKASRRLERSIVKRPGVDGRGPFLLVVTEGVEYSYLHHEGTPPHIIRARNAKVLSWTRGDRRYFARSVHHPGTQPNRYLLDNLKLAGR